MVTTMKGTNMELAHRALAWAMAQGMREIVLCAGARNLAVVATAADTPELTCWSHPEERSAGFFALGRIRAGAGPVGVLVTSGTAVAELLPAAIEAYYQGLPLLLLTADRPLHYRGSGAPQAIEQAGIFGPYATFLGDIEAGQATPVHGWNWDQRIPAHLNLCFDEPILDGTPIAARPSDSPNPAFKVSPPSDWDGFGNTGRLLVMVGGLAEDEREPVARFLEALGAPVWLESTSRLWGEPSLLPLWVRHTDAAIRNGLTHVLRLGGVPCDRLWRDLESHPNIQVRSLSRQGWSGLGRASQFFQSNLSELKTPAVPPHPPWLDCGNPEPSPAPKLSENDWFTELSGRIPGESLIFLGNSLPIREWQTCAQWRVRRRMFANRGANGIDGEISTFLGLAAGEPGAATAEAESWGIFGDLTTLYDMAAPWVLPQISKQRIRLVVINNGGGAIFSKLPALARADERVRSIVCNQHSLDFASLAAFWKIPYVRAERPSDLDALPSGTVFVEIVPIAHTEMKLRVI